MPSIAQITAIMVEYGRMKNFAYLLILSLAYLRANTGIGDIHIIENAKDLNGCIYDNRVEQRPFAFEAVVTAPSRPSTGRFALSDNTGSASLYDNAFWPTNRLLAGDRIFISGFVRHDADGKNYAMATNISVRTHGPPPRPVRATFSDINSGRYLNQIVAVEGNVLDAFQDEIDPRFVFLILSNERDTVYLSSEYSARDEKLLFNLVGARISVKGLCTDYRYNYARKVLGLDITIDNVSSVKIVSPAPANPFDVPMLKTRTGPIGQLPNNTLRRMKIQGQVLATWHRNRMIVRTSSGDITNIRLSQPNLPACGDFVEVTGLPETDFYRWNLSRGTWRKTQTEATSRSLPPRSVTAKTLLTDKHGRPQFNALLHGETIRLCGLVQSITPVGNGEGRILLDCEGLSIPVDIGSIPAAAHGLERNSTVEVTGTCVMETESWSPHTPFPHVENCFIVVRTTDDIRVIASPPWWTIGKLLGVIGSLLVALLAFGVWNRTLQHLADRRGRQLFKEQIVSARSEMRIEERTRLAIELHDSISQNLTGISMQIDAANRQLEKHPDKTRNHLGIASRTLDSCRGELRNCIWDLRNQTLDEKDMNLVLRRTLQEHIENTNLQIRFNVPRTRLSENTTHAIVRIIRELVTNAVRHGKATHIRIAGALESDRLLFSVADDGVGFVPCDRPSVAEGHFGLQGVQERLRQLHGTIIIDSAPGKGTKVTAQIPTHLGEKRNG